MTTVLQLITLALRKSGVNGVGQTPAEEDLSDALSELNMMMAQWSRRRWLVYHLITLSKTSTGAASYTVGPSGDFDCVRADRLESAFVRLNPGASTTVDYPLTIIPSREDYNAITLKSFVSVPTAVFLDSDWPMGTVYIWPVPASGYQINLTIKEPLSGFASTSDNVDFPPEYEDALLYGLAYRMASSYQIPVHPQIETNWRAAMQTLRMANTQIPTLRMPATLASRRSSVAVSPNGIVFVP